MFNEWQTIGRQQNQELWHTRAAVEAIPDGTQLAAFPSHCTGAGCWCRPYVSFVPGAIIVRHKNLDSGEFDS